jgi:hypothetical protein
MKIMTTGKKIPLYVHSRKSEPCLFEIVLVVVKELLVGEARPRTCGCGNVEAVQLQSLQSVQPVHCTYV